MAEEFWADKFDRLRSAGDPLAALRIAMQNALYPGSVRDARLCVRDAVRADRKAKVDRKETLSVLWRLGVYDRFMHARPCVSLSRLAGPRVGQTFPAFNAIEKCAKLKPWDRLTYNYDTIGYLKAGFLKTECKWFREAWGEPTQHQDPAEVDAAIWQEIVDNYSRWHAQDAAEDERLTKMLNSGRISWKQYSDRRYSNIEVANTESGFIATVKQPAASSGWWTGLITPPKTQNRGLPQAKQLGDGTDQK